ncbi:MAG: helix-turn-helix domain-containing protein [Anaerolineaceae bacterium]|jgi:hypothetical protein|nr:helix-turn-helix domain-containing protein [Anaerolineaceae bacterium]
MSENQDNSNCRISRNVLIKAPGLLPMLYTPREIAEDLDVPETTLRDWLNHGAPHRRDGSNHIWIDGKEFAAWIDNQRNARKKPAHKLEAGEGFCMRCNAIVKIQNGEIRPVKGHLSHLKGKCPNCGGIVNRGIWNAGSSELPQG